MWWSKDILAIILIIIVSDSGGFSKTIRDGEKENVNIVHDKYDESNEDDKYEHNENLKRQLTSNLRITENNHLGDTQITTNAYRNAGTNENHQINEYPQNETTGNLSSLLIFNVSTLSNHSDHSKPVYNDNFSKLNKPISRAQSKQNSYDIYDDSEQYFDDEDKFNIYSVIKDAFPDLNDNEVTDMLESIATTKNNELRSNKNTNLPSEMFENLTISMRLKNEQNVAGFQEKPDLLNLYSFKTFSIPISKNFSVPDKLAGIQSSLKKHDSLVSDSFNVKSELQSLASNLDKNNSGDGSNLATVLSKILDYNYTIYNTTHLIWYDIFNDGGNSTFVPLSHVFNKDISMTKKIPKHWAFHPKASTIQREKTLEWYKTNNLTDTNDVNVPLRDMNDGIEITKPLSSIFNSTYITSEPYITYKNTVNIPRQNEIYKIKQNVTTKLQTLSEIMPPSITQLGHMYEKSKYGRIDVKPYELNEERDIQPSITPVTAAKAVLKYKIKDKPLVKPLFGVNIGTLSLQTHDKSPPLVRERQILANSPEMSDVEYKIESEVKPLLDEFESELFAEEHRSINAITEKQTGIERTITETEVPKPYFTVNFKENIVNKPQIHTIGKERTQNFESRTKVVTKTHAVETPAQFNTTYSEQHLIFNPQISVDTQVLPKSEKSVYIEALRDNPLQKTSTIFNFFNSSSNRDESQKEIILPENVTITEAKIMQTNSKKDSHKMRNPMDEMRTTSEAELTNDNEKVRNWPVRSAVLPESHYAQYIEKTGHPSLKELVTSNVHKGNEAGTSTFDTNQFLSKIHTTNEDECGDGTFWIRNCHYCYCYKGNPICDKIKDCVLKPLGDPMICKPYSKFSIDECYSCECNGDGVPECKAECGTEAVDANTPVPNYQNFFEEEQAQEILTYYKDHQKLPRVCHRNNPTCKSGTSWFSNCHRCFCLDGKHQCHKADGCVLDEAKHDKPSRCKPNTKFYPRSNNLPCNSTCTCDDEGSPICSAPALGHFP